MRWALVAIVLGLGVAGPSARADAAPGPRREGGGARENDLKGRVGIGFAKRLLESDEAATRLRGIVRLGAMGSDEAIEVLLGAVEKEAPGKDARARLEAVRVLAPLASKDSVRQFLLRETGDLGATGSGALSPLAPLLRGTAALALARSGEKKAISGLFSVVAQGGVSGEAAMRALRIAPPEALDAVLEGRKRLPPGLALVLAEIGDVRSIDRLRGMLGEGDPLARAAAAIALARLGDETALAPARGWAKSSDVHLRRAAAEVFVDLDASDAGAAVAALIAAEPTRAFGLELADLAPSAEVVPAILAALPDLSREAKLGAIATLGRAGARGVPPLTGLLTRVMHAAPREAGHADPASTRAASSSGGARNADLEIAMHAAFALARAPGVEARRALEQALAEAQAGDAKRLVARAGVVRALELDDAPRGLEEALLALASSRDVADRGAGVFGLVATGSWRLRRALGDGCTKSGKCALEIVAAAARGAIARAGGGDVDLAPLEALLHDGADPPLLAAAGVALAQRGASEALATSTLLHWAEAGGPISPLAARLLPRRDSPDIRGRIKRLLEGTDPVVRAHVALGLGRDPEPDAASLLVAAYRFEDDASVRRAIIRGLAERREVQREATLALAERLDPDDGVRALARAARLGQSTGAVSLGRASSVSSRQVAWVAGSSNDAAGGAPMFLTGRIVRADGLALPFTTDADGTALVPGLPSGQAGVKLEAPPP